MSSDQTFASTILSEAGEGFKLEQDHKRELDQKHKWALGEAAPHPGQPNRRPQHAVRANYSQATRRGIEWEKNKAAKHGKVARKGTAYLDPDTCTSDSSAEEDIKEASAAPEPDVGVTYSFDAARSPGKGSEILSMAIAKAVEKYETQATEKLIKTEYEVVGKEKEFANEGYIADEEEFEFV